MQAAITKNCAAVIAHAQSRKAYKGAVLIGPTETAGNQQQEQAETSTNTAQATQRQQQADQPAGHAKSGAKNTGQRTASNSSVGQTHAKSGRGKKRKSR